MYFSLFFHTKSFIFEAELWRLHLFTALHIIMLNVSFNAHRLSLQCPFQALQCFFLFFLLPHYLILQHAAFSEPPTGLFQKNCFSFFKYRPGSKLRWLRAAAAAECEWLLCFSVEVFIGSQLQSCSRFCKITVFSLNVNIRPHWAPGESHL